MQTLNSKSLIVASRYPMPRKVASFANWCRRRSVAQPGWQSLTRARVIAHHSTEHGSCDSSLFCDAEVTQPMLLYSWQKREVAKGRMGNMAVSSVYGSCGGVAVRSSAVSAPAYETRTSGDSSTPLARGAKPPDQTLRAVSPPSHQG